MSTWWKEAIVYQIYPRSFYDSNGDGIGDINGITQKLTYLKKLGINVIWICPTYQSPMSDNGYDISDYYQMDPLFGTNEDLYQLIEEAKKLDIKLIMDLVVNHTSDEHEWFKDLQRNPDSKYKDYYILKEGNNGHPPNNWRSLFGGSAWEKLDNSDLYYLHLFGKHQPDLNWENDKLREEIVEMINFWLEKGISGFRIDAISYIKKNLLLENLPQDDVDGMCFPGPWTLNQPGIDVFLNKLKEECFNKYDCMSVAEANVPYHKLDQFIGKNGYFDMVFDFSYADLDIPETGEAYINIPWNVADLKKKIYVSQEETQKYGWGALYLENHDQPRSLNKYLQKQEINFYSSSMLAGLFMMLRGTPFIYQGQELGMTNCYMETIDDYRDISAFGTYERAKAAGLSEKEVMEALFRRSRDNARTPFQWDDSKNAGFSSAETTWIKINENYTEINAKQQLEDEQSLFYFYQELIQLRTKSNYASVFCEGKFERYMEDDENVISYTRLNDDKKVLIICNFQNKESNIMLQGDYQHVLCSNYKDRVHMDINTTVQLRAFEYLILGSMSVSFK